MTTKVTVSDKSNTYVEVETVGGRPQSIMIRLKPNNEYEALKHNGANN